MPFIRRLRVFPERRSGNGLHSVQRVVYDGTQLGLLECEPHRQPAEVVSGRGLLPHGVLEERVNQGAPGGTSVGASG